jgi:hypothetical protein
MSEHHPDEYVIAAECLRMWKGAIPLSSDRRIAGYGRSVTADVVEFGLPDGTSLKIPDSDLQRVYEALWDLAGTPGAIATAAMLIDEEHRPMPYRHPVELNDREADALKQAVVRSGATAQGQ